MKDAGASVVAYAHYCDARDDGRAEEAAAILAGISDYNEYDCLSTLELRNWLLGLARERGITPGGDGVGVRGHVPGHVARARRRRGHRPGAADLDPLEVALAGLAGAGIGLSEDDRKAVSMLAAAVSYHRRERKAFWWAHFDRCENGPDTHHQQDRNVFLVEDAEVLEDWRKVGAKLPERRVKLIGTVSPGSDLREGSTWFRMYEPPLPAGLEGTGINGTGRNGWFGTEVLELGHEDGKDTVIIRDKLRKNIEPYSQVPVALTEDQPIQTKSLEDALAALASGVAAGVQRGILRFPAPSGPGPGPPGSAAAGLRGAAARAGRGPGPVHRRDHRGRRGPGPLLRRGPGSARNRQDPCGIPRHRPAGGPGLEGRRRRPVPCGGGEPAEDRRDQGRRRPRPRGQGSEAHRAAPLGAAVGEGCGAPAELAGRGAHRRDRVDHDGSQCPGRARWICW